MPKQGILIMGIGGVAVIVAVRCLNMGNVSSMVRAKSGHIFPVEPIQVHR